MNTLRPIACAPRLPPGAVTIPASSGCVMCRSPETERSRPRRRRARARQESARRPRGPDGEAARDRRFCAFVQDASGQPVDGVRTPYLLPCPADRLRAAGFRYDASIHPTWVFGRYNNLRSSRRPWRQCGLLHLPISVVPFVRWPVSFLWYRAAGARLGRRLAHLAAVGAPYLHLYFHPWEAIEIHPLGVPRWVAVRTGAAFVVALDDLLVWSVPRYRCMTLGTFARGCAAPDLDQEGP